MTFFETNLLKKIIAKKHNKEMKKTIRRQNNYTSQSQNKEIL